MKICFFHRYINDYCGKIFTTSFIPSSPKIQELIRKELNEKKKEEKRKRKEDPLLVREAKETQRNVFN